MGNKVSSFTEDQLEIYQACTFLTRKEILRAHKLFRKVTGGRAPLVMTPDDARNIKADFTCLDAMAELKENPFRRRICEVFSSDKTGALSFDQFLEMFSVFSEISDRDIKVVYAFRIYDFDGDGFINENDLSQTVKHLTHDMLHPEEVSIIVTKVLDEIDMDCDGQLSQSEFSHAILKSPDFVPNFRMRI